MRKIANLLLALVMILVFSPATGVAQLGGVESADEAIARYKALVKKKPDSVEALCGLADAYTRKYIETSKAESKWVLYALKYALDARKIDRRSALPHISMTRAFIAQEKFDKALERAKQAVELAPKNTEARKLLEELEGKVAGKKDALKTDTDKVAVPSEEQQKKVAQESGPAWAAPQLCVNDILNNPSRYYNAVVEIEGDVMKAEPGVKILTSGTYILTDDIGGKIEVRSRDLPAIGKRFVVKGEVSKDASGIYLRELGRKTPGFPVVWLVVAIAIFVVLLVVVLLVIAFRPQRAVEAPQPVTAQPTPSMQVAQPTPSAGVTPSAPQQAARRQPTEAYLDGIQALLTIIEGPADVNKVYPITKKESIIGRDGDIKLSEAHLTISNEHARLTYAGEGKFTLTHLSQTNTTKVNGQNVSQSCALQSGDEIQLGGTKLRFEIRS